MFIIANNRVGLEDNEYGDEAVNFYGSSYAVGPDGNYVGEVGSTSEDQLLIRDLDLEQIRTTRERWQFFRDRRPDAYGAIVAP
jgi:N-carbamoylputrescine amidase